MLFELHSKCLLQVKQITSACSGALQRANSVLPLMGKITQFAFNSKRKATVASDSIALPRCSSTPGGFWAFWRDAVVPTAQRGEEGPGGRRRERGLGCFFPCPFCFSMPSLVFLLHRWFLGPSSCLIWPDGPSGERCGPELLICDQPPGAPAP